MASYGWKGKILRVNLDNHTVQTESTSKYEPEKYIGARGFGARIAWEEIPSEVGPFDSENRLMFFTGPLGATMAPCSGRSTVCGVSPQNGAMSQNDGMYSWSGIGGRFGAEIKFAGYDGIVIQGKSSDPVYIWIKDDVVEIKEAKDIWGMTCGAAIRTLMKRHGRYTKVATIGPAGENKSRIGAILTDSGSAAGQGGFGGVMGSKNLKAIAIQGYGGVNIYDNDSLLKTVKKVNHEVCWPVGASELKQGKTQPSSSADSRSRACTMGCQGFCFGNLRMEVPGEALETEITFEDFCFGIKSTGPNYESNYIVNQLGINGWDFGYGIVPLLQYAKQQGWIDTVDGMEIPNPGYEIINSKYEPTPNKLLAVLMRKLAYREGELGDAMAEGGVLMARRLFGEKATEILTKIYPGSPLHPVGHTGHWDCHWMHPAVGWPHWLVSALIWATANRDPANDSVHHFSDNIGLYPGAEMVNGEKLTWDKIRKVSERLYGMEGALDFEVTYDPPEAKARAAAYHRWKGALIASLVLCDWQMPRIFTLRETDDGIQTYPQAESEMITAVTGTSFSEKELDKAGERIVNLERALDIRYGRTRDWDEAIIPYFEWPSQDSEEEAKYGFEAEGFKRQLSALYEYNGWAIETGWPTRNKLEELGLGYVADELGSLGKLP